MTTTPKALVQGSVLTTSTAIYYTAPANTKAIIKQMTCTNTTAGAVTVDIYLVDDANSPTAADQLISSKAVAANESWVAYPANGQVIESGGTIQAKASANTSITLKVSGIESV